MYIIYATLAILPILTAYDCDFLANVHLCSIKATESETSHHGNKTEMCYYGPLDSCSLESEPQQPFGKAFGRYFQVYMTIIHATVASLPCLGQLT